MWFEFVYVSQIKYPFIFLLCSRFALTLLCSLSEWKITHAFFSELAHVTHFSSMFVHPVSKAHRSRPQSSVVLGWSRFFNSEDICRTHRSTMVTATFRLDGDGHRFTLRLFFSLGAALLPLRLLHSIFGYFFSLLLAERLLFSSPAWTFLLHYITFSCFHPASRDVDPRSFCYVAVMWSLSQWKTKRTVEWVKKWVGYWVSGKFNEWL